MSHLSRKSSSWLTQEKKNTTRDRQFFKIQNLQMSVACINIVCIVILKYAWFDPTLPMHVMQKNNEI